MIESAEHAQIRSLIKGPLQVNAKEIFMVSQFLAKDVLPPRDPRCLIDIKKKGQRRFYTDFIPGPHEGRFENINRSPEPLTNQPHVASPMFKKYARRPPLFQNTTKYPIDFRLEAGDRSPDPLSSELDQNRATGRHRNLSQGVPDLSKMTKR